MSNAEKFPRPPCIGFWQLLRKSHDSRQQLRDLIHRGQRRNVLTVVMSGDAIIADRSPFAILENC